MNNRPSGGYISRIQHRLSFGKQSSIRQPQVDPSYTSRSLFDTAQDYNYNYSPQYQPQIFAPRPSSSERDEFSSRLMRLGPNLYASGAGYQVSSNSQMQAQPRVIQNAEEEVFKAFGNNDPKTSFSIMYNVQWEIPNFMLKKFTDKPRLGRVLVLTGDINAPQGDTVKEYLNAEWGEVGLALLREIETILDSNRTRKTVKRNQLFKLYPIQGNLSDRGNSTFMSFKIVATRDIHVTIAAAFAWLISAVRFSRYEKYASSTVKITYPPELQQTSLKLRLEPLAEINNTPPDACWCCMFKNMVIATGFPLTRARDPEARGIALSPESIYAAGKLLAWMTIDKGTAYEGRVLVGYSTLAWPIYPFRNGSIQWHFFNWTEKGNMPQDPYGISRIIASKTPKWYRVKEKDERNLRKQTAFVGWLPDAETRLGANVEMAKKVLQSGAKNAPWTTDVFSQSTTMSPSLNGYGSWSFTFTRTKAVIANSNSGLYEEETVKIKERLQSGLERMSIVYDEGAKIGWLLPETTIYLYLAQVYLLQAGKEYLTQEQMEKAMDERMKTWAPGVKKALFPHPAADSGPVAMNAIMHLTKDELNKACPKVDGEDGEEETFDELFAKIIFKYSQIQAHLSLIYNAGARNWISQRKIVGVDLMQLALRTGSGMFKQADIKRAWAALPASQPTIVLFCKNLGKAIGPIGGDERRTVHCKGKLRFDSVPTNQNYLVATVPSVYHLLKSHTAQDERGRLYSRLSDFITWIPSTPLIEVHRGASPCNHVQVIRLRKASEAGILGIADDLIKDKKDPQTPKEKKLWNSALIFDSASSVNMSLVNIGLGNSHRGDPRSHVTTWQRENAGNPYVSHEKRAEPSRPAPAQKSPIQRFAEKFSRNNY